MNQSKQYTRERLTEAATRCQDIDEAIRFLGTKPYERLGRYLMSRFAHFDIDVSHFRPLGGRLRPSTEELKHAVGNSLSIAGTLRSLDLPDHGRQRARLRQWVTDDGVDTSHLLGQAHQRGRAGPTPRKTASEVLVKHESHYRAEDRAPTSGAA